MSTVQGLGSDGSGKLRCFTHEFETLDPREFHEHCVTSGHTLSGQTDCKDCGRIIQFENIAYPKDLNMKCPDCLDSFINQHKAMYSTASNGGNSSAQAQQAQPTKEANIQ
jgi:hypothetical protein